MNVGILVHSLPPWAYGGNPREAMQIADTLSVRGDFPTIFYFGPRDTALKNVKLIRMNCVQSPPHTADILSVWRLVSTCLRIPRTPRFDAVIAFAAGSSEGLAAPIISNMLRTKFILRTTGNDIYSDLRKYPFLVKPPLQFADAVVPINEHMAEVILRTMPDVKEKVTIIPVAIDVDLFTPELDGSNLRMRYGMEQDFVVLTIARLVKIKGVDYLVRAMSHVVKENDHARLIIIGDGPERENLVALTKKLNLTGKVFFERLVSETNLPPYYAACDVFVLPSVIDENGRTEAFGKVLAEAQACGRPVIGTRVGGIPSTVENGRTGLLVEQRDPIALSNAIIRIMSNPDIGSKFGENGRKAVVERYSSREVMKQWVSLIDAIHE